MVHAISEPDAFALKPSGMRNCQKLLPPVVCADDRSKQVVRTARPRTRRADLEDVHVERLDQQMAIGQPGRMGRPAKMARPTTTGRFPGNFAVPSADNREPWRRRPTC